MRTECFKNASKIPNSYHLRKSEKKSGELKGFKYSLIQDYEKNLKYVWLRRLGFTALSIFLIPLAFEKFRVELVDAWRGKTIVQVYTNPFIDKIRERSLSILSQPVSFQQLVQDSQEFLTEIGRNESPTCANNLENIAPTQELQQKVLAFAKETRPLLDPKVHVLISDFLASKRINGTDAEKKLYESMTQEQFIERLLSKRALMFMNPMDDCVLRDGTYIGATRDTEWDFNNVKDDAARLSDYISYDEMQLSALLSVAGPSLFVNDGNKYNLGEPGPDNSFEQEAIICGSVGCRFEREGLMEYQHMLVTKEQNSAFHGYGANNPKGRQFAPWNTFYGVDHFPTYDEVLQARKTTEGEHRYVDIGNDRYLDVAIYKKRLRLSIEPFMQNMNERSKAAGKQAYVRLTGLGLGAWSIEKQTQTNLMLEVVQEIMSEGDFDGISDIDFIYVKNEDEKSEWYDKNSKAILVHFTHNTTATKLAKEHKDKLLGANYAWDGASFPGNEYWHGSPQALSASMDPATACACQIKDLHNIYINPYLKQNIPKSSSR